ncbi:MAG: hypothetical protein KUG82_15850 [Pseudomonadales bacterium]|nr:hypothetical protein [Pseudomonadales bacterium]
MSIRLRHSFITTTLISALLLLMLSGCQQPDENTQSSAIGVLQNETTSELRKGMKAYRDHTTGQYTSKPSDQDTASSNQQIESSQISSRSVAEPVTFEERPSDVEGGGMIIDVKGHFRQPLKKTSPLKSTERKE